MRALPEPTGRTLLGASVELLQIFLHSSAGPGVDDDLVLGLAGREPLDLGLVLGDLGLQGGDAVADIDEADSQPADLSAELRHLRAQVPAGRGVRKSARVWGDATRGGRDYVREAALAWERERGDPVVPVTHGCQLGELPGVDRLADRTHVDCSHVVS